MFASLTVLSSKVWKNRAAVSNNFNTLAAEDLIDIVVGVPLNEIVCDGDHIEIVIKTNGHAIAGSEYSVKRWCGSLKLTTKGLK